MDAFELQAGFPGSKFVTYCDDDIIVKAKELGMGRPKQERPGTPNKYRM